MKRISFAWSSPFVTAIGKKLGIDAHYFAKHSFYILIGHAVSVVRGILTGYIVARLFEKETYGQYQFILSIAGMLAVFGVPGLSQSVTRAWARGDAFSIPELTKKQFFVTLVASAILVGCIPFLARYNRAELWPLFLGAAVLYPLGPIAMVRFGGYTVGKARFDIGLRATFIWSALTILATVGILYFYQSAFWMMVVTMSIPSLVYLYESRNLQPPTEKGHKNTNAIMRYGWQLTIANFTADLVWYLDKLLISHYFGLAQLATFSVALLIPEQLKVFTKQFFPVAFAKQAAANDSWATRKKLMKVVLTGTAFFGMGIALYVALCPFFMPLLFPQYDAREITMLTAVAAITLITNPSSLFAQYLEAQGMIHAIRYMQWGSAACFAIALLALIPLYGLMGAIIARGIFRLVYTFIALGFVLRSPICTKPVTVSS